MADDRRLSLQAADDLLGVIRDLTDGLVREDFGMRVRFGDRRRIIGPAGRQRGEPSFLEHRRPSIPAARQQPESVNEHDGLKSGRVRAIDLLRFVIGDCDGVKRRG